MDNDHEGRHGTGLADQLWTSVVLEDRPCLMKASFSSRGYSLLLSDMEHFWSEEMNAEGVGKRLGELNRRLGAPVERVCEHLREAVGSLPRPGAAAAADREDGAAATAVAAAAAFSWTRREPAEPEQKAGGTVAVVALQSRMSGVPLRWEFRLSPAEHPAVWDELVAPALGMLRVLSRESAELRACIRRKDVEIADYRDSGARVSRTLPTRPSGWVLPSCRGREATSLLCVSHLGSFKRATVVVQNLDRGHVYRRNTPIDKYEGDITAAMHSATPDAVIWA
ncbi:non-homologous end-joining factor 1 isoform X3 [Petromyzon marinus]|uniref:non-homologous end-joining factor 1 isoform X3 n=1 Tax=Petromyzon marinus TaxID=7757 RepID=UPI003F6FAB01